MQPNTTDAYLLFHEGIQTFSAIMNAGIRIDKAYLDYAIKKAKAIVTDIEDELKADPDYKVWYRRYGSDTNIGSREQLAQIVYGDLGFTAEEYTTGGAKGGGKIRAKANQANLEKVDIPLVGLFLEAQRVEKLLSTNFIGVQREMVERDGMWFVHPSYHLNLVDTYRSGCRMINFQNIPIRNPEVANLVRPLYIPRPGNELCEDDFSGVEVKVAYCYHKDKKMKLYLEDATNNDMHRDMCLQIFCFTLEEYNRDKDYGKRTARDSSKNQFVFPQFYGSTYFNCAKNIWDRMVRDKFRLPGTDISMKDHLASKGITSLGDCNPGNIKKNGHQKGTFVHHLSMIEKDFWEVRFPEFTAWKKRAYEAYKLQGYIDTYTGFRCGGYMPRNEVINYFIQGPAFHCNLWTLNKMRRFFKKYKMKSMLVGQIHDCKLTDQNPAERDAILNYTHEIMTKTIKEEWPWLIAPLEVETDITPVDKNWHCKRPWVCGPGGAWQPKNPEKWNKEFGGVV